MTETVVLDLMRNVGWTTLALSGPLLLAGLVMGLLVSVLQVVTSIQDPTLSFVPRILVVLLTGLLLFSWLLERLVSFSAELFSNLALYAH